MRLIVFLLVMSFTILAQVSTESEISLFTATGNTEVDTFNLRNKSEFKIGKHVIQFGGHYTLSETESQSTGDKEITARNWDLFAKYEKSLTEKLNSLYRVQAEGDKFAGIKRRDNYDLGAKYKFKDEKKLKTFFEFSGRYTIERLEQANSDGEDRLTFTKARMYFEHEKINEKFSYKFWLEYIPNFTTSEDYQIAAEPSMSVILDKNFSLKYGVRYNYDNLPAEGAVREDRVSTLSLISKY